VSPEPADDSLVLLFLCAHSALPRPAQVALTLRAVGGLSTAGIAAAFLVPEATMGQRITRAKQTVRRSGVPFRLPTTEQRPARLAAVLQVLYLIFNEVYVASSGPDLARVELSAEALRLARLAHRLMPDEGEVAGLLALILLTDARRAAGTGDDGVPSPSSSRTTTAGTARPSPKERRC
jgi:predicted RNA polymerase sigma factor